jgi:hypothetical protein
VENKAMKRKLDSGEALCVREEGLEVEGSPGLFELNRFVDDVDYCDSKTERWIWSIGRRLSDGKIFASYGSDLYQNHNFECLFLR